MNRLPLSRRAQIINALVEGNSIRSTERMFNVHRDTIMRLLVEVGNGCAEIMDEQMRELPCRRIATLRYVEDIVQTGTHGSDATAVIRSLVEQGIRDAIDKKLIRVRKISN